MSEIIDWHKEDERSFVKWIISRLIGGPVGLTELFKNNGSWDLSIDLKIGGEEVSFLQMAKIIEEQLDKAVEIRVRELLMGKVGKPFREVEGWLDDFLDEVKDRMEILYRQNSDGAEPWWLREDGGSDS